MSLYTVVSQTSYINDHDQWLDQLNVGETDKQENVSNFSILELRKLPSIAGKVCCRRLNWLEHVACVSEDRLAKKLLFGNVEGTGPRGQPMNT